MPTTLKAILRVEIAGASTSSATHTIEAEAYDKIEVLVPNGDSATVQVQPGGAGQVQLLLVTASAYPDDGAGTVQLTYAVDGGSAIDFDAPLLLVGAGAVGLLGDVNEIVFTNDSTADIDVSILVGRDATA
jgi:hypothetical protein